MTDREWEACRDPQSMLAFIGDRTSPRKFRLFGVACCRRLGKSIQDRRSRQAIEVAELYADGLIGANRLEAAGRAAAYAGGNLAATASRDVAGWPRPAGLGEKPGPGQAAEAEWARAWAEWAGQIASATSRVRGGAGEQVVQSNLLRCIFGNPFRLPVVFTAVLAHNDNAAVKLATVIYDERDPASGLLDVARLAILADAVEEAGCADQAILGHLRGSGPHVRGCHAVDAVLERG